MGVNGFDLTAQIAKSIQEMDARFVDEQSRIVAKERLPCHVSVFLPAIAHTHEYGNRVKIADSSRIYLALDFPIPRLPAPVFVHHKPDTSLIGDF